MLPERSHVRLLSDMSVPAMAWSGWKVFVAQSEFAGRATAARRGEVSDGGSRRQVMAEVEESQSGRAVVENKNGLRLMDRAKRERWDIPGSLRGATIERLVQIIHDQTSPNREVLSAVSGILAASKINLANISLMIKVHEYEELKQRMYELELLLEERERTTGNRAQG
jgi:hypothetical protein